MNLIIRYNIPSQNVTSRRHWRSNQRDVKHCTSLFRAVIPKNFHPLQHESIIVTSYRSALLKDHANLVGGAKYMIDGLVHAGGLVDDSIDNMTATYVQSRLKDMPDDVAAKYGRIPVTVIEYRS